MIKIWFRIELWIVDNHFYKLVQKLCHRVAYRDIKRVIGIESRQKTSLKNEQKKHVTSLDLFVPAIVSLLLFKRVSFREKTAEH